MGEDPSETMYPDGKILRQHLVNCMENKKFITMFPHVSDNEVVVSNGREATCQKVQLFCTCKMPEDKY